MFTNVAIINHWMKSQFLVSEILIFLEFNMLNLHILGEIHVPMVKTYGFPMESWWIHHRILSIGISTIGNPPMVNILGEIHQFSLLRGPVDRAPRALSARGVLVQCNAFAILHSLDGLTHSAPTSWGPWGWQRLFMVIFWWFYGGFRVAKKWFLHGFVVVLWYICLNMGYMYTPPHLIPFYGYRHQMIENICGKTRLGKSTWLENPPELNGGLPGENHP